MSEAMGGMRPESLLRSLSGHLWLLALMGGLLALFTSINSEFSPYFYWPYLVPAAVAVITLVLWALWRGASRGARQVMAGVLVLAGAWLVIGPWLSGFAELDFMPATRASVLAGGIIEQVEAGGVEEAGEVIRRAFEAAQVNTVTLTGAGVGGFMLALSGVVSWFACRSTAESRVSAASPAYSPLSEELYSGEPKKVF